MLAAASAGATLWAARLRGKLKGEIAAITPRGSRIVQPKRCSPEASASISMISPAVRFDSSAAQRNVDAPRDASMRASLSGLPLSLAMRRAICSAFSSMRCEARSRIWARRQAGVQRKLSKASRALSSTASRSSAVVVGTRASSAPSHGLRSTIASPPPTGPRSANPGVKRSLRISTSLVTRLIPAPSSAPVTRVRLDTRERPRPQVRAAAVASGR